jgi:hypothetical protein
MTFMVLPGFDHVEHCIAPSKLPDISHVSFRLNGLPAEKFENHSALICTVSPEGSRIIAGKEWFPHPSGWGQISKSGETPSHIPEFLYVPGYGVWLLESGGPQAPIWNSKWKPCEFPLKLEIPNHKYGVQYSILRMGKSMSPDDPGWSQNIVQHISGSQSMSAIYVAEPTRDSEWTITVPEDVIKHLKEDKPFLPPANQVNPGGGGGFF